MSFAVGSRILQRKSAPAAAPPRPVRAVAEHRGQAIDNTAPAVVAEVLGAPGQPLPRAARTLMESRFGHDFSRVRVHAEAKAAWSAHAVGSLAYTVGQQIVFGPGRYAPHTAEGLRLLAHELAHTVQQSAFDGASAGAPVRIEPLGSTLERAAEACAARAGGDPTVARLHAPALQRQPSSAEAAADPGEPLFTVFIADERRRRDKRFARRQAEEDAARIRKAGTLSTEDRQLVNAKLRFFQGDAWETYGREIKPALVEAVARDKEAEAARLEAQRQEERRIHEGTQAYYASTRQARIDLRQDTLAKFRRELPTMTPQQIYAQWNDGKEAFVSVASTAGHGLKAEQLFQVWLRHWDERSKVGRATVQRIARGEMDANMGAYMTKRLRFEHGDRDILGGEFGPAYDDVNAAEIMFRNSVNVMMYLQAADQYGRSLTLDEIDRYALNQDVVTSAVIEGGMAMGGRGQSSRIATTRPRTPRSPPRTGSDTAGARKVDTGGSTPPVDKSTLKASPPPPPAGNKSTTTPPPPDKKTIKASPPPPPARQPVGGSGATPPRGPAAATDAEVVAANVRNPASIKTQDPASHQASWQKLGGSGNAPAAYRDADGNIRVSADHVLLKSPGKGGIPPVKAGTQGPPGTPPPPVRTPVKPKKAAKDDIGLADTGQAPPVKSGSPDPLGKTPAAPPPPVRKKTDPKAGPKTAEAAEESLQPQAPRKGPRWMPKDPPQAVSPDTVKRLGSRAKYTVDAEAHQKAWQLLGGKGNAPPAFISEGNIYLDPSRWPRKP